MDADAWSGGGVNRRVEPYGLGMISPFSIFSMFHFNLTHRQEQRLIQGGSPAIPEVGLAAAPPAQTVP